MFKKKKKCDKESHLWTFQVFLGSGHIAGWTWAKEYLKIIQTHGKKKIEVHVLVYGVSIAVSWCSLLSVQLPMCLCCLFLGKTHNSHCTTAIRPGSPRQSYGWSGASIIHWHSPVLDFHPFPQFMHTFKLLILLNVKLNGLWPLSTTASFSQSASLV